MRRFLHRFRQWFGRRGLSPEPPTQEPCTMWHLVASKRPANEMSGGPR